MIAVRLFGLKCDYCLKAKNSKVRSAQTFRVLCAHYICTLCNNDAHSSSFIFPHNSVLHSCDHIERGKLVTSLVF